MKIINSDNHEIEFEEKMTALTHLKKSFANKSTNLDRFRDSCLELCNLLEKTIKDNERIKVSLKNNLVQMQDDDDNNFDLDKKSVKKIVLKEISIGQTFYPSDIANKYNLDLKTLHDVITELKEDKQISNVEK